MVKMKVHLSKDIGNTYFCWKIMKVNFILIIFLIFFGIFLCNGALKTSECVNNSTKITMLTDVKKISIEQLDKVVSCYYNTPNTRNTSQLMPLTIHPHLCTHINVAFATVKNKVIYMDEHQYNTIIELGKLKKANPKLKILLSVGGSGNRDGFSDMVIDHASRKTFIKSLKHILRSYSLDGIDLDWEFPGVRDSGKIIFYFNRERQHFSQLLREIRMEYIREKRDYLLTVAVAAQQIIVDAAYDVDQINLYVDYVNLMSYDYHYYTSFTPFTGLNSPLYPRPSEQLYMETLNVNYSIGLYLSKGLEASKIVLGVPTYGHSFTLVNGHNANIGSPASGFGQLGKMGFVNYPDICIFIKKFNISVSVNKSAKVPYINKNLEWVSYDNPESVKEKAKFIKEHRLRGAMIYSLNADDYEGRCQKLQDSERFPLTMSIKSMLGV